MIASPDELYNDACRKLYADNDSETFDEFMAKHDRRADMKEVIRSLKDYHRFITRPDYLNL